MSRHDDRDIFVYSGIECYRCHRNVEPVCISGICRTCYPLEKRDRERRLRGDVPHRDIRGTKHFPRWAS